jgi:hypothetical protein
MNKTLICLILLIAPAVQAQTLENSPAFRTASREIFASCDNGRQKGEDAFFLMADGTTIHIGKQFNETAAGGRSMHIDIPKGAIAINHVHPDLGLPEPSPRDVQTSQDWGIPVYAESKSGLYRVNPTDGTITKVFAGTEWMEKNPEEIAAFNKNISKDGYTVLVVTHEGKTITINAGKDYPIELLVKLRKQGYEGKKVKNAQAFGPGELKEKS